MAEGSRVYPFQFTGSGGEYFRIWIVNLALSVLTLGVYSAWAKVRRKRYFNNHTLLDGHNFDYLADPIAILKGRLIAFGLFALYALAQKNMPWLASALLVLFFFATPWIVLRSLQFNARNSRYRDVRFDFKGDLGEAFRIFVGWGLLMLLSLGLLLPYLLYRKTAFIAGNHAFGATRANFLGRGRSYFGIFMKASLIMLAPLVFIVAGGVILISLGHEGPVGMAELLGTIGLGLLLFYAVLPIVAGYVKARVARLMFLGTRLGKLRFAGRHTARGLIVLYVSNLLLIVLTLGLYIPWARVRGARFWLDNLAVVGPENGLDDFVATAAATAEGVAATGAEMADVFAVDVGIA
ncbi:MAG: YjgN family protein [Gallionellaceae bacterium]|nr:YjgN family protein [Gallionellaceae bacterium]